MRSAEVDAGDPKATPHRTTYRTGPMELSKDRANNWDSHPWMSLVEDRLTGSSPSDLPDCPPTH